LPLLGSALGQLPVEAGNDRDGELLYNGLRLSKDWPPRVPEGASRAIHLVTSFPAPEVIPIDVGRQLLVDDFLIESTTLTRTFHRPEYSPANPVLRAEEPWEKDHAAPFSDGVWFDGREGLFKMWYWARGTVDGKPLSSTCLATSRDGIHWEKPHLDVVPGTNVVLPDDPEHPRNSGTVWLDLEEVDPAKRFKMFQTLAWKQAELARAGWRIRASFSPDGVHWRTAMDSDLSRDRTTVFYNSFRKVWVASLRTGGQHGERIRAYHEGRDLETALHWRDANDRRLDVDWVGADELDPARDDLALLLDSKRPFDEVPSQLYNLDCIAYESVLLGLFSIWRGQQVRPLPKINEVCVGFSRDGFHWLRPDRRAFCPVAANGPVWNSGNLQSSGGCCLIVGDKLYFYVGAVPKGSAFADPGNVGLAILRRDGFASMDAAGTPGGLTTRLLTFHGSQLFVNANVRGELKAEILDESGRALEPFTLENCAPIKADSACAMLSWKGADDFSKLRGKAVRIHFELSDGQLYAFWVSPDKSGASNGFVAAGGPGLPGAIDRPQPLSK
jgi:hypothetical protein